MKMRSFFITLAVYILIYCNGVYCNDLDIVFPKGEKLETDQEYLPVIGRYAGSGKELKLTLNGSSIDTVKLEKGNIFTDKIKLNSGLNELKIVNGAEAQTINILYEKEKKNTQGDYTRILIHAPVLDNECSECHTGELKDKYPSVDISKVVCFNCHDSFEKNKFAHGPIGSGVCAACHDPHGSIEIKFLRGNKNRICYMCHEEDSIKTEHLANLKNNGKEECSYCHDPHGGKDKFFLKEMK